MKKILVAVAVLFIFVSAVVAQEMLSMDDVIIKVDPAKNEKAKIKEYYKTVEGKQVKGSGKVVKVIKGRSDKFKVTILTPVSNPGKGYNVVLVTKQDTSGLQPGQTIQFSGKLGMMNIFRGGSVDVHGDFTPVK